MLSPINNQQNFSAPMIQGYASIVSSIRGGRPSAEAYPLSAGYTAFLIDEENKMFFIKSIDVNGSPRKLREFSYEEVTPEDPSAIDTSKFATKEDFNLLLAEIRKLQPKTENKDNSMIQPQYAKKQNRRNFNGEQSNDGTI